MQRVLDEVIKENKYLKMLLHDVLSLVSAYECIKGEGLQPCNDPEKCVVCMAKGYIETKESYDKNLRIERNKK